MLITFILLNILNVILQTVKSIVTVRCGKTAAAGMNALAYFVYTIVTIYLLCDLPLYTKAAIVALCNLVGVFVVKWIEERARKDKLWKIETTVPAKFTEVVDLKLRGIPHNYFPIDGGYTLFNIYCATQQQSRHAKFIIDQYETKYFVSESKTL